MYGSLLQFNRACGNFLSMELQINNTTAETKLIKKFSDYKQQKKVQMIIDGKEL